MGTPPGTDHAGNKAAEAVLSKVKTWTPSGPSQSVTDDNDATGVALVEAYEAR